MKSLNIKFIGKVTLWYVVNIAINIDQGRTSPVFFIHQISNKVFDLIYDTMQFAKIIANSISSSGSNYIIIAKNSSILLPTLIEEGKSWRFTDADSVIADTSDQDLYVSTSADGAVHVSCEDPEGVTVERNGGRIIIKGAKKTQKAAAAFDFPEGEEISLTGILNMVGKAIRNVASNFQGGKPVYIEVPEGQLNEIELNSRSGDIEYNSALARKMTARSTSGNVTLQPDTERTAEKLTVSAVSGDAEVHGSAMEGEVSSMSGDVTVDGVFETLEMKSTSGEVEFNGSVLELKASSISGDVTVTVENTTVKSINAKSTSGDVEIDLPDGLNSVHAECATVSGDCLSRVSDAGYNAAVQIRAKSVSGDVTVE